ncbi:MAG: hypothetical protein K0S09_13 [Sphingobacteriaceae bacterium]|jgi:hypothetical protein|nr:hypothetical protein [Sphingobacteriaceae bacterium]
MSKITNLPQYPSRILKADVKNLGIVAYDVDNGYPQRMVTLVNACSTAKSAINKLSSFTIGRGFKDVDFYKAYINDKRLTCDKLLRRLSADKSMFRGFAIHVNWNALYQVESVNYVPFEYCRVGDEEMNPGKICVSPLWFVVDSVKRKKITPEDIEAIDRYNPDPAVIEEQVNAAGGWDNYKGQVYWHSDDFESYPLSSIDPVVESVIAEIESDKTTTNNLKNNFQLKTIWVEKGKFEDEREREEHTAEIQKFIGSEGNPVAVVESTDPEGNDIPQLMPFTSALNDKLFEYTDTKVRQKIYRSFEQDGALHSDTRTISFNKDNITSAYTMYNNITQPVRDVFEEVFKEIFTRFKEPINKTDDYTIIPLDDMTAFLNGNTQNAPTNI